MQKELLLEKLGDPEFRHAYAGSAIRVRLPAQIRAMRKARGLTQQQLAERMGVTQNAIARWENPGSGSPSIKTLLKLSAAFDVSLLVRFDSIEKLVDEMQKTSTEELNVEDSPKVLERMKASASKKSGASQKRNPRTAISTGRNR